ncbi:hypothetical protein [Aquisalimonas sp.]|uniref:hypothetical protein n=1 Tax=Aquisalimonas sp. TaxID=1872621 RepID=UPI0025B84403|nr:hypothetical protein [Aquisalimonas sp.]
MTADHRHHVILVRDWDVQVSGSGCCGRLSGGDSLLADHKTFADARSGMEAMGEVYRALSSAYGERLDITVIDPRNFVTLAILLTRHAWQRGGWRQVLRAWRSGISHVGVVCDGEVLFAKRIPGADEAVHAVGGVLSTQVHRPQL